MFPDYFDPDDFGLTFVATPWGDLNANGDFDIGDVDMLSREIRGQSVADWLEFDLNSDEAVDALDLQHWILEIRQTWIGDSNLDGEFNSGDLVEVFTSGEYEDELQLNSGWATGDWNTDGEFDSSDLVAAFADGGFEAGPRVAARAVPEPSAVRLAVFGVILMSTRRYRFGTRKLCI